MFQNTIHFLPFGIVAHERIQITMLAIFHCHIVPYLLLAIDRYRLLLLEASDGKNVRVTSKHLANTKLLLSALSANSVCI